VGVAYSIIDSDGVVLIEYGAAKLYLV